MASYSSSSARVFRQPTAQERAAGKTLRIEPPISQMTVVWWRTVAWWIWLIVLIGAVALIVAAATFAS